MNYGAVQVDRSSTEVQVRSLQAQSLRDPQSGSGGQEDHRASGILKFSKKFSEFFRI